MEKNIFVVDEQGLRYGVTYPKRAKGLVKNGRARYVDQTTICLTCPPDLNLESINMNESASVTNSSAVNKTSTAIVENENYTIPYILKQLEQITADTGYILQN